MKYVKQFAMILLVSFAGELLNYLLPLPVPASIYGLVLMLVCLLTGIIKLDAVRDTACFLIEFIPAAVGLMASWSVIKENLLAYLVIAVVTTVAVMAVSGLVTQGVLKRNVKGEGRK